MMICQPVHSALIVAIYYLSALFGRLHELN